MSICDLTPQLSPAIHVARALNEKLTSKSLNQPLTLSRAYPKERLKNILSEIKHYTNFIVFYK